MNLTVSHNGNAKLGSDLKFSHNGNKKLGKNISTLSRETIATCLSSCQFYHNGCYAERVERIYPSAKKAYRHNVNVMNKIDAWQKLRAFFLGAAKKNNAVRLNVSGDFMIVNEKTQKKILDMKYINNLVRALESIPETERPKIWMYTHVPNAKILRLAELGVKVYGSIDSPESLKKFKAAGFKFFAFTTNLIKGKDTVKALQINGVDKMVPVCPEQIGTKKSCEDCKICINQTAHVAFLRH